MVVIELNDIIKKTRHYHYVIVCKKPQPSSFTAQLDKILSSLSPAQQSLLEKRLARQRQVTETRPGIFFLRAYLHFALLLHRHTQAVLINQFTKVIRPDNQPIRHQEFKGQMSFQFPLWYDMFDSRVLLDVSYTQLSYWQFYVKSQLFQETNYESQLFFTDNFSPNALGQLVLIISRMIAGVI